MAKECKCEEGISERFGVFLSEQAASAKGAMMAHDRKIRFCAPQSSQSSRPVPGRASIGDRPNRSIASERRRASRDFLGRGWIMIFIWGEAGRRNPTFQAGLRRHWRLRRCITSARPSHQRSGAKLPTSARNTGSVSKHVKETREKEMVAHAFLAWRANASSFTPSGSSARSKTSAAPSCPLVSFT
jgi:hypothetical protein